MYVRGTNNILRLRFTVRMRGLKLFKYSTFHSYSCRSVCSHAEGIFYPAVVVNRFILRNLISPLKQSFVDG